MVCLLFWPPGCPNVLTAHLWSLSGQQLLLVLLITWYYDQLPNNYLTNQHTSISIHHHLLYVWSESRVSASLIEKVSIQEAGPWCLVRWAGRPSRYFDPSFQILVEKLSWVTLSTSCQCGRRAHDLPITRRFLHWAVSPVAKRVTRSEDKAPCVNECVSMSKKLLLWSCSPAWWHLQQTCGCHQTVSPPPCGPRYAPSGKLSHPGGSSPDHRT